jgi:hypothetical protein
MEQIDNAVKLLQGLPEYYREFYGQMLVSHLKTKMQL